MSCTGKATGRRMTNDEKRYYEQMKTVLDLWHVFYGLVDSWIDCGNYDSLHEMQKECEHQEEKMHEIYKQAFCKHDKSFSETECTECGKKFDQFIV